MEAGGLKNERTKSTKIFCDCTHNLLARHLRGQRTGHLPNYQKRRNLYADKSRSSVIFALHFARAVYRNNRDFVHIQKKHHFKHARHALQHHNLAFRHQRIRRKVLIELSATITRDKIVRHRAFRRDFWKSVAMKPPRLRVRFISTLRNERLQKNFPHQVQE